MIRTAILTGFKPFGRYAVNPTGILAEDLDGKVLFGHKIRSMVFPTGPLVGPGAITYGGRILNQARENKAAVIISLGIASGVKGVKIEAECSNWVENEKYCSEAENRKVLIETDPPKMRRYMPVRRLAANKLLDGFRDARIPSEERLFSRDAGQYCCNALMYRTLRMMDNVGMDIPFIYAHVSCTKEAVKNIPDFKGKLLEQDQLRKIVEIFLRSYR